MPILFTLLWLAEPALSDPGSAAATPSLWRTLLVSCTAAAISGVIAFSLAINQARTDRGKWLRDRENVLNSQFATLRQNYISPLRYWAQLLHRRVCELNDKKPNYGETSKWFQQVKDHADGHARVEHFAFWSSYVGGFAVTTLYLTAKYFEVSRTVWKASPFVEVDPVYSKVLESRLDAVRAAFTGKWGIWDFSQEVIAELLASRDGASWDFQDFCKALDSRDDFKIGPLLRPMDYYISVFPSSEEDTAKLSTALSKLIEFLDSHATPERGKAH